MQILCNPICFREEENMKKIFGKLALLCVMLTVLTGTLSGCNSVEKEPENVIYITSTWGQGMSEENTSYVNDYLKAAGCDYMIKYITFGTAVEPGSADDYCTEVMNYAKENPVDIFLASAGPNSMDKVAYDIFIENDLLEPLDEYLESDKGRELYSCIPVARWESIRRNGHIYGVSGDYFEACTSPAVIFSKKLLEKYGYSEADVNCGIGELSSIVRTISEGEADNPEYTAISMKSWLMDQWPSLYMPNPYMDYVGINDEGRAECIFSNEEYRSFLKDVFGLAEESGVKVTVGGEPEFEDCLMTVSCWALPWFNPVCMFEYTLTGYKASKTRLPEYIITYPYGMSIDIVRPCAINNCVMKQSRNKERAYDFLTRVYTDKKLSEIVLYGRENVTYEIHDGLIYTRDDDKVRGASPSRAFFLGNSYISPPGSSEIPDKDAVISKYADKIQYGKYYSYFYKIAGKVDLCSKISQLGEGFLSRAAAAEDFDGFYDDFLLELNEAGLSELLDDIQNDFDEWSKKQ